jgi:putative transposase
MRKSRFTESQIVAILKEGAAGVPVAELIRKHGISRPTYFNWKAKYGGASVPELRDRKSGAEGKRVIGCVEPGRRRPSKKQQEQQK